MRIIDLAAWAVRVAVVHVMEVVAARQPRHIHTRLPRIRIRLLPIRPLRSIRHRVLTIPTQRRREIAFLDQEAVSCMLRFRKCYLGYRGTGGE